MGWIFFEVGTPGLKLVSHIVFEQLPHNFRHEGIHWVGTSYPTLNDLFKHSNEVIRTISKTKRINELISETSKYKHNTMEKEVSVVALQNFSTSSNGMYCRLCANEGHRMTMYQVLYC